MGDAPRAPAAGIKALSTQWSLERKGCTRVTIGCTARRAASREKGDSHRVVRGLQVHSPTRALTAAAPSTPSHRARTSWPPSEKESLLHRAYAPLSFDEELRAPERGHRQVAASESRVWPLRLHEINRLREVPRAAPADEPSAAPARAVAHADSASVLGALMSFVEPIAAFCIIWPGDFAYATTAPAGDAVAVEDLFDISSRELASAFGGDGATSADETSATASATAGPWQVDRLPLALQRAPFLTPGVAKLALRFRLDGKLVGLAGLSFPRELGPAESAWYAGCAAAFTQWIAAPGSAERRGARLVSRRALGAGERGGEERGPAREEAPSASLTEVATRLSKRELEVAEYPAQGHSALNVGASLGLSVNTVRSHVRRIYAKLEVCSRVELSHRMR
jgi:DNA-binding CsgD family transcriptional regulator